MKFICYLFVFFIPFSSSVFEGSAFARGAARTEIRSARDVEKKILEKPLVLNEIGNEDVTKYILDFDREIRKGENQKVIFETHTGAQFEYVPRFPLDGRLDHPHYAAGPGFKALSTNKIWYFIYNSDGDLLAKPYQRAQEECQEVNLKLPTMESLKTLVKDFGLESPAGFKIPVWFSDLKGTFFLQAFWSSTTYWDYNTNTDKAYVLNVGWEEFHPVDRNDGALPILCVW